jgi:hypothetical protein
MTNEGEPRRHSTAEIAADYEIGISKTPEGDAWRARARDEIEGSPSMRMQRRIERRPDNPFLRLTRISG